MACPVVSPQQALRMPEQIAVLRALARDFPDNRTGKNCTYRMEDALLGAFSVFYTQCPSFLTHQIAMSETRGMSNAQTLFGMRDIPSDNHIRNLLDPVDPQHIYPAFERTFNALNDTGQLDTFRMVNGQLLIALDGTSYHQSHAIHCPQCTVTEHKKGGTSYTHTVVTPVVVSTAHNRVIPLEPEFVTPQDGHAKQDCESAAAHRWITAYAERYRHLHVTLLGDDLYSRQPMCEEMLRAGFDFILVCKPASHTTLYAELERREHTGNVSTFSMTRREGKKTFTDTYRFAESLPLRAGKDALMVNWCELKSTSAEGKTVYHNAFATTHTLHPGNVAEIVKAGRARWRIENGNNNTLKTKGYHLSHNFGHGQKYLSATLATLNLLAFLLHTVQELTDFTYRTLRDRLPTRKAFFEHVRVLTQYHCFESFSALLEFMLSGLNRGRRDSG